MNRASEFDPVRWANVKREMAEHLRDTSDEALIGNGVGVENRPRVNEPDHGPWCYACYGLQGSVPDCSWVDDPTSAESFTCTVCGRTFAHVRKECEPFEFEKASAQTRAKSVDPQG